MECLRRHELYELERGRPSREEAERLRRHLAECAECRAQAEAVRDLAAMLEALGSRTRVDLSDGSVESLYRRARVHGLLGRPLRAPLGVRLQRSRVLRVAVPAAAAVAAAVLIGVGVHLGRPERVVPAGALDRLVAGLEKARGRDDLGRLARVARAAVGEELSQGEPDADRVADLVLVSYITRRPREDRQAADARYLASGVAAGRSAGDARRAWRPGAWPMLASVALASVEPAEADLAGDPLAEAKALALAGRYKAALAAIPPDAPPSPLEAWCLEAMGGLAAASRVLAEAEAAGGDTNVRVLRADLSLWNQDVAEAMRGYEALAGEDNRHWFASGYLYRYELADPRGAGLRFGRVGDARLAAYVKRAFARELAAATQGPTLLASEDFDEYGTGAPADWAIVRARGGEFRVVDVADGKALQQEETGLQGAELLLGSRAWTDYTVQVDLKVLETVGDYELGVAAYRQGDGTGYILELSPRRLRLLKQFTSAEARKGGAGDRPERLLIEPEHAQSLLDEAPVERWWHTVKIRVQRVADGVSVAGKYWRTDRPEPLGWQVVWTDEGQGGLAPLEGGLAGVQINGGRVLVDNLVVTQNEAPDGVRTAGGVR